MYRKVLFAVLLSAATCYCVLAQKFSGDVSPLKGQTMVNVTLDFSGTLVNGKAEEKYIAEETKGKTSEKKDDWLSDWNDKLRTESYALLLTGLKAELGEDLFWPGEFPDAEYSIIIKVKEITTGHFAGPFSKPSVIKADVSFVETGKTTPFASMEFKNCSESTSSVMPYLITRVSLSFGQLGYEMGQLIYKKLN